MGKPVVLAVSGVKNSGKTTLIERVLPRLNAAGLKTAVIKHDGHAFQADPPDTDTGRHFGAGACGVAIFDGEKSKVIRRGTTGVEALFPLFPEAELILLEGLKASPWPKLEVVRAGNSGAPVCAPETVLAYVTDLPLQEEGRTILPLNDPAAVAAWLVSYTKEQQGEN